MAIDMITNNISSLTTSSPNEDCSSFGSDSDFDFCISTRTDAESSTADELFEDGLIRPLQLQERFVVSKSSSIPRPHSQPLLPPLPPLTAPESIKPEIPKEELTSPQQKLSFWHFKRSWSLHSDSSHKKGSFWSLPLLSRSNSTGSIKERQKQSQNSKQPRKLMPSSSSSGSVASFYTYPLSQKPGLRKSYGGSHSNGVVINPVLNFPPPCNIKGAANLSVFGSLYGNGRDKKDKK